MSSDQLTLADAGELAPVQTFARTANRQKSFGVITKAPWDSWQMSRVAKYIKFAETYCIAPKTKRGQLIVLHQYQRECFERLLDPETLFDMEKWPRGNAKTTTVGTFGTAALFLNEDGDIPIVASTVKQAEKTSYGVLLAQTGEKTGHSELSSRVQTFTSVADKRIWLPQTNSVAYPMADSPDGLQGLNPSVAILDEASEASTETWEALCLASGKRPDSITVGLSTPSFRLEGNAMLDFENDLKSGEVMEGSKFYEHTAPLGCDYKDERNWFIANPALSTDPPILQIKALRASVNKSEQRFRCYRLAQWPTMALEGWLGEDGPEIWADLEDPWTPVKRARTFAGVDVSLRHDSTAIVFLQQRPDGRWHAWAEIFYPDTGVVDQAFVKDAIRKAGTDYNLVCGYDPRFFESSAQDLDAEGFDMEEIPQSPARMVPAVAAGYRMIVSRNLSHDGDPAFGRQVVNAKARPSEGGITITKSPKARGILKCDAAVALCLAASLAEGDSGDISEDQLNEWFRNNT